MQVNEGLQAGDLEGVISSRFSIDQYKSKMGEDRNIMVLAFTADSLAPAKDLERFAETGYKDVLDADSTPGTLADGKHRVFVEFARQEGVVRSILKDPKTISCVMAMRRLMAMQIMKPAVKRCRERLF